MQEETFSREALLIGQPAVDRLARCRVAVFGVGGVGGYVVEALTRAGVGALDLIDADRVSLSNLNRQLIATLDTVGELKVDVLAQRIARINPACQVTRHAMFYLPENADAIDLSRYDYVVDAIDTVSAKIVLAQRCEQLQVPLISAMGAGNKLDPTKFVITDITRTTTCPLARVMRRELRKRGVKHLKVVYSKEKALTPIDDMAISCRAHCICPPGTARKCTQRRQVPGSNAYVPAVAGLICAGEVINDIALNRA